MSMFYVDPAKYAHLIDEKGYLKKGFRAVIHQSRYSKWLFDENRFETWVETCQRYMTSVLFIMARDSKYEPSRELIHEVYEAILCQEVMPSMRCMYSAGPALEKDSTYGYNCAGLVVDSLDRFGEAMYEMMCGAGVGYNVQRKYVGKLPAVASEFTQNKDRIIRVGDSREGWAACVTEYITALVVEGQELTVDVSDVRPAGARLKTSGGYSQGPGPLLSYLKNVTAIIKNAAGRQLESIEVHDMMTLVCDAIENGGGRRGAMIAIFDFDDAAMISCKSGDNINGKAHRRFANNSACYPEEVSWEMFDSMFDAIRDSYCGEPGIFNLPALRRGVAGRRDPEQIVVCNPCGEVLLRDRQFCNLTEVIVRPEDDISSLYRKVKIAAIIGTWQSSFTNFPFLHPDWKKNCEEERLLGVSLSGVFSNYTLGPTNPMLANTLDYLKKLAIMVNQQEAAAMGINASLGVTNIKPSGTVSLLTEVPYGLSPPYSEYFLRTIRIPRAEPLCQLMIDAGVRHEQARVKQADGTYRLDPIEVFYFPCSSPDGVTTKNDLAAKDHFDYWLLYKKHWSEHNPSITIEVRAEEWAELKTHVFKNLDQVGGVTFFPFDNGIYEQAPLQRCSQDQYLELLAANPRAIPFNDLWRYMKAPEDESAGSSDDDLSKSQIVAKNTEKHLRRIVQRGAMEMGCSGGSCAVADLV